MPFLAAQPRCTVAMEACATAHDWGRAIADLGHDVRLIPPVYVKPFVKRQKNDAADAEAIVEAASRPTMRFVAVKTEAQQARAMIFRTRDLLVRQRTQLINALRGHLAEHGVVVPKGTSHLGQLSAAIEDEARLLPSTVREIGRVYLEQISAYATKIIELGKTLRAAAVACETTARLQTMPGIGPITAMAIEAFAPPMETFQRGRDFAAWLGLVPVQRSTGGKQRLGKTSKMGQRDIRRLLIVGAWPSSVSQPDTDRQKAHGSHACWQRSRACSSRSRSPTRWRVPSGRCSRARRASGFRWSPRPDRRSDRRSPVCRGVRRAQNRKGK